jgi:ketosteroid isomerase-like protein
VHGKKTAGTRRSKTLGHAATTPLNYQLKGIDPTCRKHRCVALLIGTMVLCNGCAYSQSAARKYIENGEKQWAESVATNDASVLERILAEDFVWVYPTSEKLLWSKSETIADAKAGPGNFVSDHVDEMHVRFWGDTAFAQGVESWVQQGIDGNSIKGRFIWTDIWLRRHGRWQIVQAQDQAIGPARER